MDKGQAMNHYTGNGLEETLSAAEAGRLQELETTIERGLQTFIEVGEALREIRDHRLYRGDHPTFEGRRRCG